MIPLQPDYLAETSRPIRRLAIALLMAAAFVSTACLAVCLGALLIRPKGLPMAAAIGSVAIFAFLTATTGWMSLRLLRGVRAHNGRTVMPVWFIRAFGVVLLAGIVFAAVASREPLLLLEGAGAFLAMIGVRRLLNSPERPVAS